MIMEKQPTMSDFIIENGILQRYTGDGPEAVIPHGVTKIKAFAFHNCKSITSVIIPDSVTEIDKTAFYSCTSLASLAIPDSVITIGNYAFANCASLQSVTIGKSITTIGGFAFFDCRKISTVYYTGSLEEWSRIKFTSVYANPCCFCGKLYIDGVLLTEARFQNDLKAIESRAFQDCLSLTDVIIPDNITEIGEYAFQNCSNLANAIISQGVNTIKNSAFSDCPKLTTIYYTGTKDQWESIKIGVNNQPLSKATIYYNYQE